VGDEGPLKFTSKTFILSSLILVYQTSSAFYSDILDKHPRTSLDTLVLAS
jgi:hypothetical protein